jgi:ATP-binding cassette subfamily C protein CydC
MAAFEAVLPIPLAFQYLDSSLKAAQRVFEITEQIPQKEKANKKQLHGKTIALKNVDFSYNKNEMILKNISIELKSNKKIAIIGGSGAGKSSIINLLLKFWEINSGKLTIDNNNYKNISSEEVRNIFSTIPQKVFLFSNTIKENLLIAKPNATDNELWSALQKAELKEFVESLPNKLNAWIGNQGKELSGGEKKRIAIARAVLQDSPIFICDEITADIDSINELKIVNTIHSITAEKALIFITHRLVGMENFDSIYLLENGKIISVGSHNELISKSEKYQKYFEV